MSRLLKEFNNGVKVINSNLAPIVGRNKIVFSKPQLHPQANGQGDICSVEIKDMSRSFGIAPPLLGRVFAHTSPRDLYRYETLFSQHNELIEHNLFDKNLGRVYVHGDGDGALAMQLDHFAGRDVFDQYLEKYKP